MIFRVSLYLAQQEGLTFVRSMVFLKNKKQNKGVFAFALVLFSSGLFFLGKVKTAYAIAPLVWAGIAAASYFGIGAVAGDTVLGGLKILLYSVFTVIGWFASIAITMLDWAVNPDYISGPSGLLNRASVYVMWKFIRDFFNLFFILTLLYTAFTIVFQVAKDYKKTLLSLVLAALFVNFSFPITRVIIDATNVPMYYFANQMGSTGTNKSILGSVLSASQIQEILIPGKLKDTGVSQLIMAIIFLFIFSITLLVLAVLFVVRLAALVILLIFASVGFAASVIPGMQKFSAQWWENLWKYALFGPSAMLMLFVATRFFAEISSDNTKAQFITAATTNSTPETVGFISAMAMFSIPIIMLWFAIGLGGSMAIAGGAAVTGKGKDFLKWAGRKTYSNTLTRGIGKGIKERAENNKYAKVLTPKFWTEGSKQREERISGKVGGGKPGYDRVVENQHNKKVAENEKEMEELRTSATALKQMLEPANSSKHSAAEKEAAVNILAKKEQFSNANELHDAVEAIKASNANPGAQREKILALAKKANGDSLDGMSEAQYNNMATMGPDVKKELDRKLKTNGKTNVLVTIEMATNGGDRTLAVDSILKGMKTEDVAKQELFRSGGANKAAADTYMASIRAVNPDRYQKIQAELP
ncbi:MAG: hypothetical protein Q8O53_03305 [Candidatus Moranbacteria bacterium]|nr:hypothetical protein [Candidatus Moranbacteria bacterium]